MIVQGHFTLLYSAVVVTAATCGTTLNTTSYEPLGLIDISEGANADFPGNSTNATIVMTAPTNYQFNSGVGTVGIIGSPDITSASIAVTNTTITVTWTTNGGGN